MQCAIVTGEQGQKSSGSVESFSEGVSIFFWLFLRYENQVPSQKFSYLKVLADYLWVFLAVFARLTRVAGSMYNMDLLVFS